MASGVTMLGSQRQVTFILAVLVIDHNDHAAGANLVERAWDVGEWRLEAALTLWHIFRLYSRLCQPHSAKLCAQEPVYAG